jgi:hypothetical protein
MSTSWRDIKVGSWSICHAGFWAEHAWRNGYLFGEKEYTFLKQTVLTRRLSPAQMAWKEKINRRILAKTKVRQRTQR